MTPTQEQAITLSLNVLHVGFFECPKHYYEYFINNDEWALLMVAAGLTAVDVLPQQVALGVLRNAAAREGFFADMTDFRPPAHHCSFLEEKIQKGERNIALLRPCEEGQQGCPYATFENFGTLSKGVPGRPPR